MNKKTGHLIYLQIILLIFVVLIFGNCKSDNTKQIKEKPNATLVPNLERDAPVVWHIQDELYCYMYWIGNFEIKIDSVYTLDPETYNETLAIFHQTMRKDTWYLKDCDQNIYAESFYVNDTLISIKKLRPYNISYDDMKNIGNFEQPELVRKEIDYN